MFTDGIRGRFLSEAHWLEKLGLGGYGKGRSYDPWNPPIRSPNLARDSQSEFQFYDVIIFQDDDSYHAQLKGWLARQREVYREIVAGLVKKGLITSEEAAKPVRMNIYGIDTRRPRSSTGGWSNPPLSSLSRPAKCALKCHFSERGTLERRRARGYRGHVDWKLNIGRFSSHIHQAPQRSACSRFLRIQQLNLGSPRTPFLTGEAT